MDIVIKGLADTRKEIIVTFSKSEVSAEEKTVLHSLSQDAVCPGFRKGKVPHSVIRSRLKKEFEEKLESALASRGYQEVLEKSDLKICSLVQTGCCLQSKDRDSGYKINLVVDISPEFELLEYKGIPISVPDLRVTDEQLENYIKTIREDFAKYEKVVGPAEKGHKVNLTYIGYDADGKEIKDAGLYGKQIESWERAGENTLLEISAITESLVGMTAGDRREVIAVYPEDFRMPTIAGLTVKYEVEVHEVISAELPALDEAFFKEFGVETHQGFREHALMDLQEALEADAKKHKNRQIIDYLVSSYAFPLPESLVDLRAEKVFHKLSYDLLCEGWDDDAVARQKDKLVEKAYKIAERIIRQRLILLEIAKKEGIGQGSRLNRVCHRSERIFEFISQYANEPDNTEAAYQDEVCKQVMGFLIAHAEITAE